MAKDSSIEWTDDTQNFWWGCSKISAGCDHCYADSLASRYGHDVWGANAPRRFLSEENWNKPFHWDSAAAAAGIRRRVFCSSMSDFFEDRTDLVKPRKRALSIIADTENLDWLLLTKRPHLIEKLLPRGYWFPSNVWLGTTVEDQIAAKRIKHILQFATPAVRFLSCEPLLGPVDIREYLQPGPFGTRIDWVIVGGESGHGARPMNPAWAEDLLDQCQAAGVPFFFKQWGNWGEANHGGVLRPTTHVVEFRRQDGTPLTMARLASKKASGRLLLGREWNELPVVNPAGWGW